MIKKYNAVHKYRMCGKVIRIPLFRSIDESTVVKEILITTGIIPNDKDIQPIEKHIPCNCSIGAHGITDLIGIELISESDMENIEDNKASVAPKLLMDEPDNLQEIPPHQIDMSRNVESKNMSTKPTRGVIPKWLWQEQRRDELIRAINERIDTGKPAPMDWVVEYNELTVIIRAMDKPGGMSAQCRCTHDIDRVANDAATAIREAIDKHIRNDCM